jgi:hypothetical protein
VTTARVVESVRSLIRTLSDEELLRVLENIAGVTGAALQFGVPFISALEASEGNSAGSDGTFGEKALGRIRVAQQNLIAVDSRSVFRWLETILGQLRALHESVSPIVNSSIGHAWYLQLERLCEHFLEAYSIWLRTRDRPAADQQLGSVLHGGTVLYGGITSALSVLVLLEKQLTEENVGLEDEGEYSNMELRFESGDEAAFVAMKLAALAELYVAIGLLLGVAPSSRPLRVIRLESGSLWGRLFGASKIVEVMAQLIHEYAAYLFRTKTQEGQIGGIPTQVAAVRAASDLEAILRERGHDTGPMKSAIDRSGYELASNLHKLLAYENRLEVNGREVSLYSEAKLFEDHRRREAIAESEAPRRLPPAPAEEGNE